MFTFSQFSLNFVREDKKGASAITVSEEEVESIRKKGEWRPSQLIKVIGLVCLYFKGGLDHFIFLVVLEKKIITNSYFIFFLCLYVKM